jgi:hypothetical protein
MDRLNPTALCNAHFISPSTGLSRNELRYCFQKLVFWIVKNTQVFNFCELKIVPVCFPKSNYMFIIGTFLLIMWVPDGNIKLHTSHSQP